MTKLNIREIQSLALGIVKQNPGGIRYSLLRGQILKSNPETPKNTIAGAIWNLHDRFPREVTKPSRGLFMPVSILESAESTGVEEIGAKTGQIEGSPKEQEFYEPFAQYLKNDLDEVTDVVPLGGAKLKTKWGTPDVLGVYKPLASNLIKFPQEIVSAEIKADPSAPVVAFGQAVAYRLFSTKTYIALPTTLTQEDQGRLESLCMLFGVGLVLFDPNPDEPNFTIRMRAQRFAPDMFYVNELADRLKTQDSETFEKLFR